jgi:hypothetical protein
VTATHVIDNDFIEFIDVEIVVTAVMSDSFWG